MQHAQECHALATQVHGPDQRELMLTMAEHWEQLAADRLELIRKHRNLARPSEEEDARGWA